MNGEQNKEEILKRIDTLLGNVTKTTRFYKRFITATLITLGISVAFNFFMILFYVFVE